MEEEKKEGIARTSEPELKPCYPKLALIVKYAPLQISHAAFPLISLITPSVWTSPFAFPRYVIIPKFFERERLLGRVLFIEWFDEPNSFSGRRLSGGREDGVADGSVVPEGEDVGHGSC